jgi:hypothetical protein
MKKEVKNTIEKINTIVFFDEHNFDIGMKILNDNLAKFIGIKEAFKVITGKDTITTIEALNAFIISTSGFPNIRASVQLLDFENEYDFIITNYDLIDMDMVDAENNCVPIQVIEDFRTDKTVRLNNDCEHDYQVLLNINKLYATLKFANSYQATNGNEVFPAKLQENYRIATARTF